MKKLDKINRLIALGALCVGGAAALAGCGKSEEDPMTLYGPPEDMDSYYGSTDTTEEDTDLEDTEDESEISSLEEDDSGEPMTLYGPGPDGY